MEISPHKGLMRHCLQNLLTTWPEIQGLFSDFFLFKRVKILVLNFSIAILSQRDPPPQKKNDITIQEIFLNLSISIFSFVKYDALLSARRFFRFAI